MPVGDGSDPISDDEIVYRRVTERSKWYQPDSDRPVDSEAFKPNRNDVDGISVWRAKYKSPMEVAQLHVQNDRRYYVLALNVGMLRAAGVVVEPTPPVALGHASFANLTIQCKRENKNRVSELAMHIADRLVVEVHGPFGPFETCSEDVNRVEF